MKRSFDEYMNEAIEKGWFHESYAKAYREVEPRVLFESGEELPVHKETPGHGGPKRRFLMTSGHNRWSIHSMNLINNIIQNTHRGEPFVFINDRDAADLGIGNGERVKLVNDVGEILIAAKLTAACRRVRRSRPPAFRLSSAPPAGGPCTGRRPASRRG
jgi:anaerobic selenocysteine-containing dehydrogenase